jgi:hypothetical protein
MSNFGPPLQTHSFTSSALLYHTARASLPTQPVLEIGQHRCTTKQLEYSNATTSPRLQLQRLGTKETILQPELKAAITIPPTTTTKQTTTSHQLKSS